MSKARTTQRRGRTITACLVASLVGMPAHAKLISDTYRVTVNGTTWAQPLVFHHVSWNDINAQCPSGVCASGGPIGLDMTGWTWAGPTDVSALFNFYLSNAGVVGSDLLNAADVDDSYTVQTSGVRADWFSAFNDDFFPTYRDHLDSTYIWGWVADVIGQRYGMQSTIYTLPISDFINVAEASSDWSAKPDTHHPFNGAWFYCTNDCPSSEPVPAPPVLILIAIAIVGLGMSRRKRVVPA